MTAARFDVRSELLQRNSPLPKFGFLILLAYFFVAYSRILDLIAPRLHLPMIMAAVMYTATIAVGGIQRTLTTKSGLLFFLMTGWMCVSILLTPWKGNGVDTLMNGWMKTFPLYLAVVACVYTTAQVQKGVNLIAFALAITCLIAVVKGDVLSDGRLVIQATKFGDPNDLALFCNMAVMSWLSMISITDSWFKKLLMIPCVGIILIAFLKTGSRGGLLGLVTVLVYVFIRTSIQKRMLILVAVVAGGMLMGVVAGSEIKDRFFTILESKSEKPDEDGAVGSTESRIYLLRRSIEVTIMNPVFGVGPGNFMYAEDVIARGEGMIHGAWHVTHNMYTQVSSELGIPGILMYLGVLVLTWKSLNRVEKHHSRNHPEPLRVQNTAFWLKCIFIAFASSGAFLSIAYQDILPLLAGLAITLERATVVEVFLTRKSATPAQPLSANPKQASPAPKFVLRPSPAGGSR